jgi:hypothetical protein
LAGEESLSGDARLGFAKKGRFSDSFLEKPPVMDERMIKSGGSIGIKRGGKKFVPWPDYFSIQNEDIEVHSLLQTGLPGPGGERIQLLTPAMGLAPAPFREQSMEKGASAGMYSNMFRRGGSL